MAAPPTLPSPPAEEAGRATLTHAAAQRLLWLMVGIQVVMTLSFTLLSPIMPLFLPELGVHSPTALDLWTGLINASTPLVAALVSPLWGRLSDRRGRKLMLLRSTIAIAIFTGLMGLAQDVWQFMALRTMMGAFSGFSAASIALVATQMPEHRLGYALGWLSTGQLVGSLIGPIIGGGLADLTGSNRIPFFIGAVLAGITSLAVLLMVREQFTPPKARRDRRSLRETLRGLVAAPELLPLFVVLLFAQFGVRTVQPVVTLYVQQLVGNVGNVATLGGLAFSVTGLADVIASPFLGRRSDVLGYRRVLLISLFGAALFSAPQAIRLGYWPFVAERFGVGLFIGGILPTANALIGRLVAPQQRGLVYGFTGSATFLGNSLGPLTGGVVAATLGLHWVFLVTAAMLLAILVVTWRTVPASVDQKLT